MNQSKILSFSTALQILYALPVHADADVLYTVLVDN